MAVNATRTTVLFDDSDSDGKVTPGDTLLTHIIIKNTAGVPITSVSVTDTLNSHTTYNSGTTFVTVSDLYSQTGNTPKDYSAAQGLLANDFRGDSLGTFIVGSVNGSAVGAAINVFDSANLALLAGTVTAAADGSFTYTPAAGYTGTAQFTYTTSDGSHTVGSATAAIVVGGLVWYIQGGAATNGNGTFSNPFNSLASVSAVDHINDTIVVHGTASGGLTLKTGETVYGDGSTFSVNGHQITNGGTDSVINHSAAAITLASGNTIDGVDLVGTSTTAVGIQDGNGTVGNLTINRMAISGQGQIADIDQGGTLNVTLKSIASSGFATAGTGGALDLQGVTGTFGVTGSTSIDTSVGAQASGGININAAGLTATFGAIVGVNSGGTSGITLAGGTAAFNGGVGLQTGAGAALTTTGGTISIASGSTINTSTGQIVSMTNTLIGTGGINFTSLGSSGVVASGNAINFSNVDNSGGNFSGGTVTVTGTAGAGADGIHIDGGSSANFTFGTTTIGGASAVAGDAIEVNGAGNGTVSFSSVNLNNFAGRGVSVINSDNAVTVSAGSIAATTNVANSMDLYVNGGTGAVSVAATLTKTTAGKVVDISGHATGQIDVTGAISATGAVNNGISIANNTSGTVNFTGTLNLSTGANNAIDMTGNSATSASAYNFTNATQNITTTSGTAINMTSATATGPTVTFSGGNLTLSTATGSAINAVNTNAAAAAGIGTLAISGANNTVTQSGSGGSAATSININGVAEAITLKSVNVGASGQSANNAISLQNAGWNNGTNFFQIQGTGAAGTGGTLNHASGGADLSATQGTGIYLNNVSGVSLNSMNFNGVYSNYGIFGKTVNNFTLTGSSFGGTFGDASASGKYEGDVTFGDSAGTDGTGNGLTGTASFQGNTFANAYSNTVGIFDNYDSSKTLAQNNLVLNFGTTTANTLNAQQAAAGQSANDALTVQVRGNGTTLGQGFNLTANIGSAATTNNFNAALGDLLQVNSLGNSTSNINVIHNSFVNSSTTQLSGGGGVTLSQGGNGSVVTYNVDNNTFRGGSGFELVVAPMALAGTSSGVIQNNTIGQPDGAYQTKVIGGVTYGLGGVGGIFIHSEKGAGSGTQTVAVRMQSNQIADFSGDEGILIWSNNTAGNSGTQVVEATLIGNTVKDPNPSNGFTDLYVSVAGSGIAGDNAKLGLDIRGNSFLNAGAPSGNNPIDLSVDPTGTLYIKNYSGGKNYTALTTYLESTASPVNTLTNGGAPNSAAVGFPNAKVDLTAFSGTFSSQAFQLGVPLQLVAPTGTDWESQLVVNEPNLGSKAFSAPVVTTSDEPGGRSGGSGGSSGADPAPTAVSVPSEILATLDQLTLDQLVAAAIHRWELAGASAGEIAAMKAVSVTVADMAGSQIGSSLPGAIQIDSNAGGYGWFVDQTPNEDSEFGGTGSSLVAPAGTAAAGRVDLLTVIEHELGHQIGLQDNYQQADSADVMYGYLSLGERRLATADDVQAATGTPVNELAFDLAPTLIGSIPNGGQADVSFQSTVSAFTAGLAPTIGGTATVTYGANTLTASESINTVNDTKTDSNGTVTTQSLAVASLTLGDRVYQDVNNNGTFDAGDLGVVGVTVNLYIDNGTAANVWDPADTFLATTTTTGGGIYSFTGLAPGDYVVVLPSTNFGSGKPLGTLTPHPGAVDPDGTSPADANIDNDNNGFAIANGAVGSYAITLSYNNEPDAGAGHDTNNTLDFGFISANHTPVVTAATPLASTEQVFAKIDAAATIHDADLDPRNSGNGDYSGAVLTIARQAGANAEDLFQFASSGAFSVSGANLQSAGQTFASYTNSGGTLTVTFNSLGTPATTALVAAVLDSVQYANNNDAPPASIDLAVSLNDGAPGNAGQGDVTSNPATGTAVVHVNITSVNDAPMGTNATFNARHGTPHVLTQADFGYSDVDGNAFTSVTIASTATAGRLLYMAPGQATLTPVTANQVVSITDINAGRLIYKPTPGVNDAVTGSFTFKVHDDGGTANGGVDTDQSANTLTFTVQPNLAPSGADSTVAVTHGVTHVLTQSDFGFTDPDGDAFSGVTIDTVPAVGRLMYMAPGQEALTKVIAGQFVSATDVAAGRLIYKPLPNANDAPVGSFTFQVHDDAGTANGGVDTDQSPNTLTFDASIGAATPLQAAGVVADDHLLSVLGLPTGGGAVVGDNGLDSLFSTSHNVIGDLLFTSLGDNAPHALQPQQVGMLVESTSELRLSESTSVYHFSDEAIVLPESYASHAPASYGMSGVDLALISDGPSGSHLGLYEVPLVDALGYQAGHLIW